MAGAGTATSDIQALVARSDVDVVVITTPPGTHRDFLLAAVAADKHIVCEKPTALSEAEAWAMHAAVVAAPTPCLCVIDHELRFLPTVQRMRTLLRSGYCGKLFYLRLTINSPRMLPNRVRAPRPPPPGEFRSSLAGRGDVGVGMGQGYSWWSERAEGGGVLGAVGTHLIDLVAFLTGERATGVHCRLSTHVPERSLDGSASSAGACAHSAPPWSICLCVGILTSDWGLDNGRAAAGHVRRYGAPGAGGRQRHDQLHPHLVRGRAAARPPH